MKYNVCNILEQFHFQLRKLFYRFGHTVGVYTSYFIVFPVFISLFGITQLKHGNFVQDVEYLFSYEGGQSQMEKETVSKLYPMNYTQYDPSFQIGVTPLVKIHVTTKDDSTIFRPEPWNELMMIDEMIQNVTIEFDSDSYAFKDLCATDYGRCLPNNILQLHDIIGSISNGSVKINYPVMLFPRVLPMFYGGAEVDEVNGYLLSAKSIVLFYYLKSGNMRETMRSKIWEKQIETTLRNTSFDHVTTSMINSQSLTDEFLNNVNIGQQYFLGNIALLLFYGFWSYWRIDWVSSKMLLVFCGVSSSLLSFAASHGILMLLGVPYIQLNKLIIIFTLAVDFSNHHVMVANWHRTKASLATPVRIAETFSQSAIPILMGCCMNIILFCVGTMVAIPAMQIFCLYSGVTTVFGFAFTLCLFGGGLALTGRVEADNRHNITMKKVSPLSSSKEVSNMYKWFCAGGTNPEESNNLGDKKTTKANEFVINLLSRWLTSSIGKVTLIASVLCLVGGGIGMAKMTETFEVQILARDNSYLMDYFKSSKQFRQYPYRLQVIINETIEYSDPQSKSAILGLLNQFEETQYSGNRMFTIAHIRRFYKYLSRNPELATNITTEEDFVHILKTKFIKDIPNISKNFVFSHNGTRISSTRFAVQAMSFNDSTDEIKWATMMRSIASQAPFNTFVYNYELVYMDQFLVPPVTIIAAIILAITCLMMFCVIVPSMQLPFATLYAIVSTTICIIGSMYVLKLSISVLSVINIMICVGFAINFCVHLSYAYATTPGTTSGDRITNTLVYFGSAIWQGAISIIISAVMFAYVPSFAYKTMSHIYVLAVFWVFVQCLLVLPVVLQLIQVSVYPKYSTKS